MYRENILHPIRDLGQAGDKRASDGCPDSAAAKIPFIRDAAGIKQAMDRPKKTEPKPAPVETKMSFEDMLSKFKKESDEKMSLLKTTYITFYLRLKFVTLGETCLRLKKKPEIYPASHGKLQLIYIKCV